MNTHDFELAVEQHNPALRLHWTNTSEGLRMEWTPSEAAADERIVMFPLAHVRETPPAVA